SVLYPTLIFTFYLHDALPILQQALLNKLLMITYIKRSLLVMTHVTTQKSLLMKQLKHSFIMALKRMSFLSQDRRRCFHTQLDIRSEEHTLNSSHVSISYAVFC